MLDLFPPSIIVSLIMWAGCPVAAILIYLSPLWDKIAREFDEEDDCQD